MYFVKHSVHPVLIKICKLQQNFRELLKHVAIINAQNWLFYIQLCFMKTMNPCCYIQPSQFNRICVMLHRSHCVVQDWLLTYFFEAYISCFQDNFVLAFFLSVLLLCYELSASCSVSYLNVLLVNSRNNHHYAQICTTALFYILASTCFGSSLSSSGSFWIHLSYKKIQINLVIYDLMLVKWPVCRSVAVLRHHLYFSLWVVTICWSVAKALP
jgi:hypothetical protein